MFTEETKKTINVKVVVVGGLATGKTCIINRFVYNKFIENSEIRKGEIYYSKCINTNNNKTFKFGIWDTHGSERFRSILRIFMINSVMAIFVYSPFCRDSFTELNDYVQRVRSVSPDKCLYIIAENFKDVTVRERRVSTEEGEAYAQSIGAKFFSVSAKTGEGINEMFKEYTFFYQGLNHNSFSTIILKRGNNNKDRSECVK